MLFTQLHISDDLCHRCLLLNWDYADLTDYRIKSVSHCQLIFHANIHARLRTGTNRNEKLMPHAYFNLSQRRRG
jgi:hypothetical protein